MPATVAFAHATGFCGGVWRPVVAGLSEDFEPLVWDFPCHGSSPKWKHPIDWWDLGDWTLDQVALAGTPRIGVGHSMGGAALAMAELKAPGTFAGLLLIEPIILPPPFRRQEGPLSARALKRRNHFESREEARENFAPKPPFSTWDRSAFEGYLECGLIDTADGTELACRPLDEAEMYQGATGHGAWGLLGNIRAPVTIVAGGSSDTHPSDFVRLLASRIPNSEYEIVPDTGHFLPMEMPELVADRIERLAARITG
jgi:lipase